MRIFPAKWIKIPGFSEVGEETLAFLRNSDVYC